MKRYIYTVFLVLVLVLTPVYSFAKFDITPGIDVRSEYNDNIFLVETGKEDDYITTLRPDIRLEYSPNNSLDLNLDYGFDFRHYSRHSNLSEENQRLIMSASARPFNRVLIDVTNIYARVPIDIRDASVSDNTLTNMTDSNSFSISTSVVLPVSAAVSTTVGYGYNDLWFEDESSTDSETHSAFFVLNNRFSSKISGALKYNYSAYRPDLTGQQGAVVEYDRHDGSVAVEYRIASNFGIDGELGESWTDYDTRDNSRTSFWSVGADYTFAFIPDTSIEIDYSSSLSDSPTAGASKSRRGDLFLRMGDILNLTLNPYIANGTFINTDRKDETKGLNVDISRRMGGKATVSIDGLWETQRFLPEEEKIRRYSIGCGLDYNLSLNITAGIGYRYNVRSSNVDNDDFNNNVGWLRAGVSF